MSGHHEAGEEYRGGGQIAPLGARSEAADPVSVEVDLRGHFEPVDGRFHWYGRIAANAELAARHRPGAQVLLTTPHGSAEARIADVDPWGRYRIAGTGRPPF